MGIVKGAIMQINPCCLGLNCTGFLRLGVKQEKIKEVREFLEKEPYILSTWNRLQEINVGAFFAMPDLQYYNTVKDRLKSHPHIEALKPLIYVGFLSGDHPENLIIRTGITVEKEDVKESNDASSNSSNKTFVETPELQEMNPIDRNIAKMLSGDARTSFRTISKELKVSTTNVINRYEKLRKKKMFLRPTIAIDLRKLGYKGRVMIYFNIKPGTNIPELQEKLLSIPNLIVLVKTIGETDMLAISPIATLEEYFKIKATLSKINEIEVVEVNITSTIIPWPHNIFAPIL